MIGSILVGAVLTIVTVGLHAAVTAWWIGCLKRTARRASGRRVRLLPLRMLCTTAVILLMLHLAEVLPWAVAYLALPGGGFESFEECCYFATVTFASLGYGDIVIQGPWRMLSGIQAMNGLLVFGWSTALLFAVVERIWGRDDLPDTADPDMADAASSEDDPLVLQLRLEARRRASLRDHVRLGA